MTVWLVRWEWIGDHAAKHDPILTILHKDTPVETVRWYVETTYMQHEYSKSELLEWTQDSSRNPYPATIETLKNGNPAVQCGHNPWLSAKLVSADDVRIVGDRFEYVAELERPT